MQKSNRKFVLGAVAATFLLVTGVGAGQQAKAQTRLGFVIGGAAAQKATEPYSQPMGLYGGFYVEKGLGQRTALRPELTALMMRSKYTQYADKVRQQKTLMQYRVQLPILLSAEVLPHVWIMAGPQLNYSLSDLPQPLSTPDTKPTVPSPLTLGAAAGLMFRTTDGVELNLRAGYGAGWSSHIPASVGERLTYKVGIAFPISGFNGVSNRNELHSKFSGNSYQIPGE